MPQGKTILNIRKANYNTCVVCEGLVDERTRIPEIHGRDCKFLGGLTSSGRPAMNRVQTSLIDAA